MVLYAACIPRMGLCLFVWRSFWHAPDLCQFTDQRLGTPALGVRESFKILNILIEQIDLFAVS